MDEFMDGLINLLIMLLLGGVCYLPLELIIYFLSDNDSFWDRTVDSTLRLIIT